MDQTALATILTPLFGVTATKVASWIALAGIVTQAALTILPVASATSPSWYQAVYGVLSRLALNIGKNAPMPPAGTPPAGGIVPTPPALKP